MYYNHGSLHNLQQGFKLDYTNIRCHCDIGLDISSHDFILAIYVPNFGSSWVGASYMVMSISNDGHT